MPGTAFLFDESCFWHIGQMHAGTFPVGGWVQPPSGSGFAESPDSKRRLKSLMDVSGLSARLDCHSAPMAEDADLLRVHPRAYLDEFRRLSEAGGGFVGDNASFGGGSYDYARRAAGLVIAAADEVLTGRKRNAYALARPPGHHCGPSSPMGFCFLNNAAITVEAMIAKHKLTRIAIVDWDVHHGNGTEQIFLDRPDVLTISIHQEHCFPPRSGGAEVRGNGAGAGYNLNIPLLPGGGHQAYVDAIERIVIPALHRYKPELIVVACGFDANALDPLARMLLHSESYRWMMEQILAVADELCRGRVVVEHEGGYSESYVPFCGHALIEALAGERTDVADPVLDFIKMQQPNTAFMGLQRRLIDEQASALGF